LPDAGAPAAPDAVGADPDGAEAGDDGWAIPDTEIEKAKKAENCAAERTTAENFRHSKLDRTAIADSVYRLIKTQFAYPFGILQGCNSSGLEYRRHKV
jgi:hypothetical protein